MKKLTRNQILDQDHAQAQSAMTAAPAREKLSIRTPDSLQRYGVKEIADAQCHTWRANTAEHPWIQAGNLPIQKPYEVPPESLLFQMDMAGVHRCYLVTPSWYGDRNEVSVDAAKMYPDRFAVFGRINIFDPKISAKMATWKNEKGMLGFRAFLYSKEEQDALLSGSLDPLFAAAAKADVPVTMMVPGLPNAAVLIEKILQENPTLKVSIDHLNLLSVKDIQLLPSLMPLAKNPNLAMKATCLPSVSQEAYPYKDTHDLLKMVFDNFGPKRMFWGTDLTRSPCSYQDQITMFTEHLQWLKGDDLDLVMGGAVLDWYGWPK